MKASYYANKPERGGLTLEEVEWGAGEGEGTKEAEPYMK